MSRRITCYPAAVLIAVAAIGLSACGSSSSKSSAKVGASTPAPSTPSTPSTSTTTGGVTVNARPPSSTPLTSPTVRAYLVRKYTTALTSRHIANAPSKAQTLADCVLQKFSAAGIKTYGEAKAAQNGPVGKNAQIVCAKQAGLA